MSNHYCNHCNKRTATDQWFIITYIGALRKYVEDYIYLCGKCITDIRLTTAYSTGPNSNHELRYKDKIYYDTPEAATLAHVTKQLTRGTPNAPTKM